MIPFKFIYLAFLVLIFTSESVAEEISAELDEEFTEALLLRPLPDRKVLVHFHFQSNLPPTRIYGRHHHLFPKTIISWFTNSKSEKLSYHSHKVAGIMSVGVDMTPSQAAKRSLELNYGLSLMFLNWLTSPGKNLTHALSGLFCASINFLEHSTTYSAPQWNFHSLPGKLCYGTLRREAVCTENLTPWLKLLPCRDKAGLSALMNRPSIYRGY